MTAKTEGRGESMVRHSRDHQEVQKLTPFGSAISELLAHLEGGKWLEN